MVNGSFYLFLNRRIDCKAVGVLLQEAHSVNGC